MHWRPVGDRAVLVELASLADVHSLHHAVQQARIAVDSVPGWRSLLVTTDGDVRALVDRLRGLDSAPLAAATTPTHHEIAMRYDGPDLEEVARACGCSVDDVIRLHQTTEYTVAFLGFSRGFAYLSGLPEALRLPRRATPRSRVPAGSVAIALDQCGIYPADSPGGWHLLGTTTHLLFDPDRMPPTPLSPGDRVRFIRESA